MISDYFVVSISMMQLSDSNNDIELDWVDSNHIKCPVETSVEGVHNLQPEHSQPCEVSVDRPLNNISKIVYVNLETGWTAASLWKVS